MISRLLAGGVAGLMVAGLASEASAACQLTKILEVPVVMDGLRPHVQAKINGHDATMMIDTGAFFSDVTDAAAARFEMKPSVAPFGLEIRGAGGAARDARAVKADTFSFAGAGFNNIQFLRGGRVGDSTVAGVIGQNIMGVFDVEYDFANGAMRFFKATGCGGDDNLAYWSAGKPLSRIRLDAPGTVLQQVISDAYVDGHLIKVTFDSGAMLSVLSLPAAARAGIRTTSEGVTAGGVGYGVYGQGLESYLAPFASFKVGDEEIKNTRLRVSDLRLGDSDMLLGADFFLSHRILISHSQKKLYFTYNGGPVFRLDQAAAKQQAQADPAPAGTGAAHDSGAPAASDEPKTGAEFQRRGQALAARHEYPAAIADFTKAIEFEPSDGAHYHSRAMARLANRQPVLAMADLDQALKYKPDDVRSLMTRGQLYLNARDTVRGRADFEAAMKLAPDNTDMPVEIGAAYARAGLFEPAIQQFDAWISAHPKAADVARVQSERCWTRAVWGRELDKALADCDLALRGERTSEVMERRALVLYRMGRVDEALAQYNVALRLQPKSAPGLYGRGLAELKKGAKAEGEADLAAASAIAPGLAQEYRRFGLAPDEPGASANKAGG